MSQININNLTFKYDTSLDEVFKNVSLILDTDWKLGLIGRNGRGKTTLLKLLKGDFEYGGTITSSVNFEYFPMEIKNKNLKTIDVVKNAIAPFEIWEKQMELYSKDESKMNEYGEILEKYIENDGYFIDEMIKKELGLMEMEFNILEQNFETLSGGEQTKMMLIALFLRKNHFLLIDEPTNHLDIQGREIVASYLASKKGFILVSHDRNFVDKSVDHILSINKANVEIQRGNYRTWQFNKDRQDDFEISTNEKLKKDISKLEKSAREKSDWSDKVEKSKYGNGHVDRGFIGAKSEKMMKRSKAIENRKNKAIEEKSKLLKNIEKEEDLILKIENSKKEIVLNIKDLSISFENKKIFKPISFEIKRGECVWLKGENGSGKSSILKLLIDENISYSGFISKTKNISYVSQDTSKLKGRLEDYILETNVDHSILKTNLRKLGFERDIFDRNIENWSEGQKKKLLIAKSLCDNAELYIWDEPLNFVDIITRTQIEELILRVKPTMLIVEHDITFTNSIATKIVEIESN